MITEQFVKEMLQEFKEQRLIHKRFAFQILLQVRGCWRQGPYIHCLPWPEGAARRQGWCILVAGRVS